jgi:DNA-binding CsgD family transcriptional regulator
MSATCPDPAPPVWIPGGRQCLGYVGAVFAHFDLVRELCAHDDRLSWVAAIARVSKARLTAWRADIVVVDLDLPDPPSVCAMVRTALPASTIVVLMCRDRPVDEDAWPRLGGLIEGVLSCRCGGAAPDGVLPASVEVARAVAAAGRAPRPVMGARELTEGERSVLDCAAAGMTAEQTARELRRSVVEVQSLITRVRKKLGARSRAHAVALALRSGLID